MSRQRAAIFAGLALVALLLAWLLLPTPDLGTETLPGPVVVTRPTAAPVAPRDPLPEAEADPDGWTRVRCPLDVDTEDGLVTVLVFDGPDDDVGRPVSGDLRTAWLIFSAPARDGRGVVSLPGYQPTELTWTADAQGGTVCTLPEPLVTEEPGVLRVPGMVTHDPQDLTWVVACQAMVRDPGVNGQVEVERPPGTCLVQGCRRTGTLQLCLEGERVEIRSGQTTVAHPEIPSAPLAGLGINLRPADEGIAITALTPDAAADRAGLVPGDVILSIDGTDTVDLGLQGFRERGIGLEGETARLRVLHEDGSEDTVQVKRERIDLVL